MENYLVIMKGNNYENGVPMQSNSQMILIKEVELDNIIHNLKESHRAFSEQQRSFNTEERKRELHINVSKITDDITVLNIVHQAETEKDKAIGINTIHLLNASKFPGLVSLIDIEPPAGPSGADMFSMN